MNTTIPVGRLCFILTPHRCWLIGTMQLALAVGTQEPYWR